MEAGNRFLSDIEARARAEAEVDGRENERVAEKTAPPCAVFVTRAVLLIEKLKLTEEVVSKFLKGYMSRRQRSDYYRCKGRYVREKQADTRTIISGRRNRHCVDSNHSVGTAGSELATLLIVGVVSSRASRTCCIRTGHTGRGFGRPANFIYRLSRFTTYGAVCSPGPVSLSTHSCSPGQNVTYTSANLTTYFWPV